MKEMENEDIVPPDKLNILCPYCSAVWTARMEENLLDVSSGCHSCGYGGSATIRVEIRCDSCERIVYVKEGEHVR